MTDKADVQTEIDFDDDDDWLEKFYYTSDYLMFGDYANTSYQISLANMEKVMIELAEDGSLKIAKNIKCSYPKPDSTCDKEYEIYTKLDHLPLRPQSYSEAEDMGTNISKLPPLLIDEGSYGYQRMYIRKDLDDSHEFSEDFKYYPVLDDSIAGEIQGEASFHDWMREGAANVFPDFFLAWWESGDKDEFLTDVEKENAYDIFSKSGTVDTICEGTSIRLSIREDENSNEYMAVHKYLTEKMELAKEYKAKKELAEEIIKDETTNSNPAPITAPRRF